VVKKYSQYGDFKKYLKDSIYYIGDRATDLRFNKDGRMVERIEYDNHERIVKIASYGFEKDTSITEILYSSVDHWPSMIKVSADKKEVCRYEFSFNHREEIDQIAFQFSDIGVRS